MGCSSARVIREKCQGMERKWRSHSVAFLQGQALPLWICLLLCVFSGKWSILKVKKAWKAWKWRKEALCVQDLSLQDTASSRKNMGGNPPWYQLQHPHPVSTGRERSDAKATASGSSAGGKYPLSLSKMWRKIIQNRADVPPHMLIEPAVISQGRKSYTFGIWLTCSSCYPATGAVLLHHHLCSLCHGKERNHTQSLSRNFGSSLVVQI